MSDQIRGRALKAAREILPHETSDEGVAAYAEWLLHDNPTPQELDDYVAFVKSRRR